jgi:hypothetical protein
MKARPRTSPIWRISKEELIAVVSQSQTYMEILNHFGLTNKGNNSGTLKRRMKEDGISTSSMKPRVYNRFGGMKAKPFSDILTLGSAYHRGKLKDRLIKCGLLANECYECGQLPIWNGKPLTLQIDHINGISDDNRIENLRILCPHCHSQTDNFAGRNKRKVPKKLPKPRPTKIVWPADQDLVRMIKNTTFVAIAKKLGVTDSAVRKRLKRQGLSI